MPNLNPFDEALETTKQARKAFEQCRTFPAYEACGQLDKMYENPAFDAHEAVLAPLRGQARAVWRAMLAVDPESQRRFRELLLSLDALCAVLDDATPMAAPTSTR